jgi:hypothetical protein
MSSSGRGFGGYGSHVKAKRYVFRRCETKPWKNNVGWGSSIPKRFLDALNVDDLTDCRLVWVLFSDGRIELSIRRPDRSTVQNEVA